MFLKRKVTGAFDSLPLPVTCGAVYLSCMEMTEGTENRVQNRTASTRPIIRIGWPLPGTLAQTVIQLAFLAYAYIYRIYTVKRTEILAAPASGKTEYNRTIDGHNPFTKSGCPDQLIRCENAEISESAGATTVMRV